MSRRTMLGDYDNTILNGVLELWQDGAWDLAIIVFTASIVVPLLKLLALLVLLLSTHRGSTEHLQERTRLYRIIEFIGQWSMLDIFVVALLMALVHFRQLAEISAGSGAVAFGTVVVMTMLASQSFDPRLIWDAAENLPLDDEADELPATSPHFGTSSDAPP
jgi:paraquat-inducible protein A